MKFDEHLQDRYLWLFHDWAMDMTTYSMMLTLVRKKLLNIILWAEGSIMFSSSTQEAECGLIDGQSV